MTDTSVITPRVGPTTELPPLQFTPPTSILEVLASGASYAGLSAVTSYLQCPEYSRLKAAGVKRKPRAADLDVNFVDISEDALGFGLVAHVLRATRVFYGTPGWQYALSRYEIDEASRMKLNNILRLYDYEYPLDQEPFEYIGIEVEVVTDIGDGRGGSLLRSVRYDTVIRMKDDGAIFSFECKTAARSGESSLSQYAAQTYSHSALWNANPALVAKYGPMRGTIYDQWVKTEVPKVNRIGPKYISRLHQQLAIEYHRLPEAITLPVRADGGYPRFLHSCFGKYRPCEFTGLCHDNAHGDYEVRR